MSVVATDSCRNGKIDSGTCKSVAFNPDCSTQHLNKLLGQGEIDRCIHVIMLNKRFIQILCMKKFFAFEITLAGIKNIKGYIIIPEMVSDFNIT